MCLLFTISFAQKKPTVDELNNQVKNLEEKNEKLEKEIRIWQKNIEMESKGLDNKSLFMENNLNLIKEEIRTEQTKINGLFTFLFGLIGFIGIGGFWRIKKYVNKRAQEYAEKIINKLFPEKEKELIEMIKKQNEEFQFKEKHSLLVVSNKEGDELFLRRFFKEMKFNPKKIDYETLDKCKTKRSIKEDLVFFNNEEKTMEHDVLLDILSKTKDTSLCFYFGPDRFDGKEFKDKVNFANSRVQIYGNLINSLRYKSLLE